MDPVLPQQSPGPWFACVTDAEGRFEIFGLPAGSLRIVALAPDLAPLDERIELTASAPTERELRLQPGCTVRGRVSDSRGEPEANAVVSYGDWSDFVCLKTRSAEDGSFELSGLPSGRAELIAQGVEQALELQPSSATTWNPTMRPPRHR
jgi:hypothetical protein